MKLKLFDSFILIVISVQGVIMLPFVLNEFGHVTGIFVVVCGMLFSSFGVFFHRWRYDKMYNKELKK